LSLERKLPLLVTALLLAVVGALSLAVYREERRSARLVVQDRLDRAVRELGALLERSPVQRASEMSKLAADPSVRAFVSSGGRRFRAEALKAARAVAPEAPPGPAIELWDVSGQRLLHFGDSTLPSSPPSTTPDSATVGPLFAHDTLLYFAIRAPVVAEGRTVGQAAQVRRVSMSAQSRQTITGLIGSDASMLFGNAAGDPWTDLARVIPAPPAIARVTGGLREYHRDGVSQMGRSAAVQGSPWLFLVEFPRSQVFAPAEAFLRRMAIAAVLIVAVGLLGGWAVSRRMTLPLRQLTTAVDAITAGDLAHRAPVAGGDEFGRLAGAFNSMAEKVARSQDQLEAQVAERTRELELAKQRLEASSEASYRALFHQTPLPKWVYDQETLAFLDVNDAAVRHYGYSRDEFLRMTTKDLYAPEEVPRLLATVRALAFGQSETSVWHHRRKDGTTIEVEVTRRTLELGGRPVGMSVAHDLTERLRAERALRKSEEALRRLNAELETRVAERTAQFGSLAETAADAIVSANHEGMITYLNPAAERMFDYSGAEVVGKPLTILMPERFHDQHRAGLRRYLATEKARVVGRTVELVGQRKDGTDFPIELSLAAWRRAGEWSFTGIIRDISDRKRAEEAEAEHARVLDRANTELQAVNNELEAFSYSVSHDLRAPLRAVDGFSRILLEDYGPRLDGEAQRLLNVLRTSSQQMGQLIDDLLAFSRLGRKELVAGRVDMTALARAVADELRSKDGKPAAEVVIDALPPARGDRTLLRQIWANLLQNASKFTREQPGSRIHVGARLDGDETVYFVTDNGVGFDMQYAHKLFGVFQRLHRAEEFEGTGVGLAIVQRIVHRHGGRVWAEGAVNQGATFYFSLPKEGDAA
jgi:PAS domain S-box-containing protein